MTLLTRITRLFKADMHGLLDTIEEPHAVLRQAIREMEEQLGKSEEGHALLEKRKADALAVSAREAESVAEAERRITLCLEAANEVLAKSFVRKKLESAARVKEMALVIAALEEEQSKLRKRIEERKEQLKSVQERAALLKRCDESARGCGGLFSEGGGTGISEEEVEVAFLEEKQKRSAQACSAA